MKTFKVTGGDFIYGNSGAPTMITGKEKLVQDIFELTVVAKNQDGYGAGIGDMIGSLTTYVPASITWKMVQATNFYQYLQRQQPSVSEEERLIELYHVASRKVPGSKTDYEFDVYIRNGISPTPIQVCVYYRPQLR